MGNRYTYSQSFEEWCLNNNRDDILNLWDYEMNEHLPSEVPSGTKRRYYFKCPSNIHQSESKRISTITDKPTHQIMCKQCHGGYSGKIREDLTGQVFGQLTILWLDDERSKSTGNSYWVCQCSCGQIVSALAGKLKCGKKLTCGGSKRHRRVPSKDVDVFDPQYLKDLRCSPEYHSYRKEVMEKDNYQCIVCGSHKYIEVHHIYPFAAYPEYRFNTKTGICLCRTHHAVSSDLGFHKLYGRYGNTPEQLETYVNYMRGVLGKEEDFDVYEYMEDCESDNTEIDDSMVLDLYE